MSPLYTFFHHDVFGFLLLPRHLTGPAALTAVVIAFATTISHGWGRWIAGRYFGVRGRAAFFARRGASPLWFLSALAVEFTELSYYALSRGRRRIVAACGPLADLAWGIACLAFAHAHTAPGDWLAAGAGLAGMLIVLGTILVNVAPHHGRNDGGVLPRPDRRVGG